MAALLVGCDGGTTTHVHEAPTPAGPTGSAAVDRANGIDATSIARGAPLSAAGTSASDAPTSGALLQDASSWDIDGVPGEPADCASTLPCRWLDAEGQIAVTLGAVDNVSASPRAAAALSIDFAVSGLRDSAFALTGIGDVGTRSPASIALGDGNGIAAESVVAGESLRGTVRYDGPVAAAAIDRLDIVLNEAGLSHPATFLDVPIDVPGGVDVDCGDRLPCAWRNPHGNVTVTLDRAGGFVSARRLDLAFRIDTDVDLDVAMGPGSEAIAHDGFRFEARSHRLGRTAGSARITNTIKAGATLTGALDFYRASVETAGLDSVRLDLFEDAPSPRWRPGFRNVPSIAP